MASIHSTSLSAILWMASIHAYCMPAYTMYAKCMPHTLGIHFCMPSVCGIHFGIHHVCRKVKELHAAYMLTKFSVTAYTKIKATFYNADFGRRRVIHFQENVDLIGPLDPVLTKDHESEVRLVGFCDSFCLT